MWGPNLPLYLIKKAASICGQYWTEMNIEIAKQNFVAIQECADNERNMTHWFLRNFGFLLTTSSMMMATSTFVLSLLMLPSISSAMILNVIGEVGRASSSWKSRVGKTSNRHFRSREFLHSFVDLSLSILVLQSPDKVRHPRPGIGIQRR